MTEALITIAEARERVLDATRPLPAESVPVARALDRVLAQDVIAGVDVPPFPSSAMDGYALCTAPRDVPLPVIGESRAGTPFTGTLREDQAVRISTGGAVPAEATAVVRQEDVTATDGQIEIHAEISPGENVRPAGEVFRRGTEVLSPGAVLGAAELAVAITAGAGSLTVGARPRVAILTTGDELRPPGEPLKPGQIHNSNGPMLIALAARCGAGSDPQQLADDRAATEAALNRALESHDVVIVSGGVSVGPHDHVKPALAALGVEQRFWGVALQPGKPTWFGTRDQTLVFGLPGNPVSAAVTFSLFAAPALAVLQGASPRRPPAETAVLATPVPRNRSREQAIRVRLEKDGAHANGDQGSHVVTSLVDAHALALIPPGEGRMPQGTVVTLADLVN